MIIPKVGDSVTATNGQGEILNILRVVHISATRFETDDGRVWCSDGGSFPKKDRPPWGGVSVAVTTGRDRVLARASVCRSRVERFARNASAEQIIELASHLPVT